MLNLDKKFSPCEHWLQPREFHLPLDDLVHCPRAWRLLQTRFNSVPSWLHSLAWQLPSEDDRGLVVGWLAGSGGVCCYFVILTLASRFQAQVEKGNLLFVDEIEEEDWGMKWKSSGASEWIFYSSKKNTISTWGDNSLLHMEEKHFPKLRII